MSRSANSIPIREICGFRFVIVGKRSEPSALADGLSLIKDIFLNRGALGGIHSALIHSKSDWTIILACDYPFVSIDLIKFLQNLTESKTDFDAFAPIQPDGKIQPLCAIYKTETCRKILSEMLENEHEKYSVHDFLNQIKTRYVEFAEIAHLPNSENFFFNVNTPEDFILAVKLHENYTKKTLIGILKMTEDDLAKVLEIQQEGNLSHWSFEDYKGEIFRNNSFSIVAKVAGQTVGFLVGRLIAEDYCAELYNIGVSLNFRRQKAGNKLLESFIEYCIKNELEKIYLEVRATNETAIGFYLKNNFTVLSKRKNFYSNPTEDAILMVKEISSTK